MCQVILLAVEPHFFHLRPPRKKRDPTLLQRKSISSRWPRTRREPAPPHCHPLIYENLAGWQHSAAVPCPEFPGAKSFFVQRSSVFPLEKRGSVTGKLTRKDAAKHDSVVAPFPYGSPALLAVGKCGVAFFSRNLAFFLANQTHFSLKTLRLSAVRFLRAGC